jgi:hypothetical protein
MAPYSGARQMGHTIANKQKLLNRVRRLRKLETVIPHINQDVLAAKVGTTRPQINFFMNKFRKLGLIEYNGGLKVHSSLLNIIVHD